MLARPQISNAAASYMGETPLSVRRNLDDAIAVYGNESTVMREGAIDAIAEGRAAYWSVAKYHNARAADLPYALNAGADITGTVEDAYRGRPYSVLEALDTIVPLNRKAVNALALAYAKAGSFRDDAELEMRAKRDGRRAA